MNTTKDALIHAVTQQRAALEEIIRWHVAYCAAPPQGSERARCESYLYAAVREAEACLARLYSPEGPTQTMKTIVYVEDQAIESTVWADEHVASGIARYATDEEIASYERGFARDDARMLDHERP